MLIAVYIYQPKEKLALAFHICLCQGQKRQHYDNLPGYQANLYIPAHSLNEQMKILCVSSVISCSTL